MAKSKSQERREAVQKAAEESGQTPGWKENQQKETTAIDSDTRQEKEEKETKSKTVKIKMITNYRDVAKTGQVWETDAEKAAELVRLKRAEYVK